MKKLFRLLGIFAGLALLAGTVITPLGPWMDRWGAAAGGSTRLVVRSRNATEALIWDALRPGEFIMMRGCFWASRNAPKA